MNRRDLILSTLATGVVGVLPSGPVVAAVPEIVGYRMWQEMHVQTIKATFMDGMTMEMDALRPKYFMAAIYADGSERVIAAEFEPE